MACSGYMQSRVWLRPSCSCMSAKFADRSDVARKLNVHKAVYLRCDQSGFSSVFEGFPLKSESGASFRRPRQFLKRSKSWGWARGLQRQLREPEGFRVRHELGFQYRPSNRSPKPRQLHTSNQAERATWTRRRVRCNVFQGGESQGKRGAAEGEGRKSDADGLEEEDNDEAPEGESSTDKFLREMRKKAEEQAKKDKEAEVLYKYGQREYGRGEYASAVKALQAAVDLVARGTALGGEMQIWLAMAFDANGQRDEGLAVYRRLEASHPMKTIKSQAANLRYIMEAPRLKISKDERVTIPLIGDESQTGNPSFTEQYREKRRANYRKTKKIKPDIWDRIDWTAKPRWQRNPYFWVALTLWLTLIAVTMAVGD